jgi:hypothetical protein
MRIVGAGVMAEKEVMGIIPYSWNPTKDLRDAPYFLVILLLLIANRAPAQEDNESFLKRIIKIYDDRQEQFNPIWVRYQLNRFESPAWQKAFGRKLPALRWTIQAEFAQKGNKTRSWCNRKHPSFAPLDISEDFFVFTGDITIGVSNQKNTYFISKKKEEKYAAETPWSLSGEENLLKGLKWWKAKQPELPGMIIRDQEIDGKKNILLQWTDSSTTWKVTCWFLPDQGWLLRAQEIRNETGVVIDRSEVQETETVGGIVFPKRIEKEHFIKGGELATKDIMQVSTIETQPSKIPDRLFQYEFTKDDVLWDNDLKVVVRQPEVYQSHLKEVIERAGPPKRPWISWLVLTLLVVCGTVAIAWRLRRQKNA